MIMDVPTFQSKLQQLVSAWPFYLNVDPELNAIRIALGADNTTRDTTMQTAPAGLQPGNAANTPFTNAVLRLVNAGKAGNLSTITMANIIGGIASPGPPVNTVAPTITYVNGGSGAGTVGAAYASGVGTWVPPAAQNTRTNQWMRNNTTPIAGATAATYTAVAADSGNTIALQVTMTNAGGSTPALSNVAAIA